MPPGRRGKEEGKRGRPHRPLLRHGGRLAGTNPDETRDLAGDPRHAGEIERLTTLMQAWRAKVGDRQPLAAAKPRPREVSFDGYVHQPDQWQPAWIIQKYFQRPKEQP